ncbi:MAG: alpha/beta hydrolase [Terrimonas sp.]|mgnify:CR=1 FL=1|nr:alpha/beta hydrolase [Terrimonas sp.]
MILRISIAILFLQIIFSATAQQPFTIGAKYSIPSQALKETREYYVYLPPEYNSNEYAPAKYPVIYLLDGESSFHYFTGLQQSLSKGPYAYMPNAIVVGIVNTQRTRDLTPTDAGRTAFYDKSQTMFKGGGGNHHFIQFLTAELRMHIDSVYRTSGYNTIVGHSFGGLTAANLLLNYTTLFNAYIMIDPSLWWDDGIMLRQADSVLAKKDFRQANIYVAMAHKEIIPQDTTTDMERSILSFETLLKKHSPKKLRWSFQYYPGEDHGTIAVPAAYNGLRFIFDGHLVQVKQAVFNPQLLTTHFKKLSAQTGFSFQPSEPYLDWMGNFCQKSGMLKEAAAFYEMATKLYPQSRHAEEVWKKIKVK